MLDAMIKKGKTGPKKNPALSESIKKLADIYEEATGEEASPGYWERDALQIVGDFPWFVFSVLNKIGKGVFHNRRALVETQITKALSERSRK